MEKWIIWTLLAVNLATFIIYGWDKLCAKKDWWRIPEKVLLGFAFIGGSLGALLGMRVFHHKTKHKKFIILVPLFLVLHVALAVWIIWHSKGC
ncbi:MAG: DUF1294 domain-containing protein [Bacteroidia bacterium]|nr:DUF1294 domain-containing protein [Bacteroidia bacterium]